MGRKVIYGFLIISLGAVALASVAGYLGREYWFLDLFSHFKVQYSFTLIVLIIGLGLLKERKAALVGLLILFINLIDILPFYFSSSQEVKEGTNVRICSINLLSSNGSFGKVGKYIRREEPDILVLEELTELWGIALDSILIEYPYQLSIPRQDNFGIGLYSKVKPDTIHNITVNDALLPSILFRFSVKDELINLLATHPLPPLGPFEFESRNKAFERMATLRNSQGGHFILIGDLNTSSYSAHFKVLKKNSGLKDTRNGFGILNTWHAEIPILRITLDHCLVSDGLAVVDRNVGPNIGSDHLPIMAELGIKE